MKMLLLSAMSLLALTASAAEVKIAITTASKPKPVVIRVGDSLTVTLDANATTGYQWTAKTPAILKAGKAAYLAPKTHLAGAGGVQSYGFKAVKSGSGTVVFTYARPWEKKVKPIRTENLKVIVKP